MSLYIILKISKNIFVRLLIAVLILISFSCESVKKSQQAGEWISLFNEKDLKDWKIKFTGYELNDNYKNTFRVEDGILKSDNSQKLFRRDTNTLQKTSYILFFA